MTPVTDEITPSITKLRIAIPKIVGPIVAGILAALIAYRHMPNPNAIDAIIAGLTLMVPLLGGGMSALSIAAKTNAAGVNNPSAAPAAPPGVPNVTSEPVSDPPAELRG